MDADVHARGVRSVQRGRRAAARHPRGASRCRTGGRRGASRCAASPRRQPDAQYHSARAFIEREGAALERCVGVVNFDQTGTGAEREGVYAESNDVPWNEALLRAFENVGKAYLGKDGFSVVSSESYPQIGHERQVI